VACGTDLLAAADQAADAAVAELDGPPDLVAVFVCGEVDRVAGVGARVAERTGAAHVIGCTAGGVIGGAQGLEDVPAVSVWAAQLPGARLRTFHLEVIRTPDGMTVIGMPERAEDDGVAVVLADPWSFPAESYVQRVDAALPGLALVGGLASGPGAAGSTRLFLDGRAYDRGAVGVLLGGDIELQTIVAQGCRPIGHPMTVTSAEDNVVLEIAGMPALAKLEQVVAGLCERDRRMVRAGGLAVGIARDEYAEEMRQGDFLVRGILGADAARSALAVGDRVEIGQTITFQVRDAESASEDLRDMLGRAVADSGPAAGALLFSCNGRGKVLFPDPGHDIGLVRSLLGADGVAGFFAAGELGPVAGRNHLHGFTASVLAFR
jgi:small ligand-binding sensory domain FIST